MPWKKENKENFLLRYLMAHVSYILDIPKRARREELAISDVLWKWCLGKFVSENIDMHVI